MGEDIRLKSAAGEIGAYLATPKGTPKGGVVVIQEIFGVNHHIRAVTDKFAADGYIALAPRFFDHIKPGIELGVYILPPEFVEVAQDAAQFAGSVTFLSPMAYYKDWGLPATWIVDKLLPQTIEKAGRTKVIPVFDEDLTEDAGRTVLSQIGKTWPAIDTLAWFSYGRWTSAALQRIDRLLQS